jgi:hypothetical protein
MADVGENGANLMRRLLFAFLVLASLPVTARAVPFAQYNPANGDVVFRDVRGNIKLALWSRSQRLNADIETVAFEVDPAVGTLPVAGGGPWGGGFSMPGFVPFPFDTLTAHGVVQPHTPLSDLSFTYHAPGVGMRIDAPLVQIPEPSALAIAASSLIGLSLIRRRRR